MPVFDFLFWNQASGGYLTKDGPIIPVEVSVPAPLEQFLIQRNVAVPPPVSGYALIDTGAGITGIHQPVLDQLSLIPIDTIQLQTPSSIDTAFVYPTRVAFPSLQLSNVSLSRVVGNQLGWQTSQGNEVIMLLGRDLLQNCLLIYNAKSDSVTLSLIFSTCVTTHTLPTLTASPASL